VPVRERSRWCIALTLLTGCTPVPPEVADTGVSSEPGTTIAGTMGTSESTAAGSATVASADGTGSSGDGPPTTMPADSTMSGSSGASESTSMEGGTSTTGGPVGCHPLLVEVYYDPQSAEDDEQWVKLYDPCGMNIDLGDYSLGWSGTDYTFGTLDLQGSIVDGECFIVGGPLSIDDNAFPMLDQAVDFDPDVQKGGGLAQGIALFLGDAASIAADTIPVDAVIYGNDNSSGLLDAEGNMPAPHVGGSGDQRSIRRTGEAPTWIIEADPMPGLCPRF
jgi:hypothetical protein